MGVENGLLASSARTGVIEKHDLKEGCNEVQGSSLFNHVYIVLILNPVQEKEEQIFPFIMTGYGQRHETTKDYEEGDTFYDWVVGECTSTSQPSASSSKKS